MIGGGAAVILVTVSVARRRYGRLGACLSALLSPVLPSPVVGRDPAATGTAAAAMRNHPSINECFFILLVHVTDMLVQIV